VSVSREDVERARSVLSGRIHRTPTFASATLGVSLKAELFQKTGSFKVRGALNRLGALTPDERERGVITWSAGNHAQAVAWAAAEEGVDCLVQMWEGVSPLKVEATRGYGATADLSPPDPVAAYDRTLAIVEEQGRFFVHPHSDPLVIAGHGTLALELLEDVPDLQTVVVGVGGGGLVSGIVTALGGQARIVAVEPEQAPAFAGELALELCRGKVETVLVSEHEIAEGMRFLYARAKLACEPAGAAAAGAVLAGKVDAGPGVAVIVSGGNVDPKQAAAILREQ